MLLNHLDEFILLWVYIVVHSVNWIGWLKFLVDLIVSVLAQKIQPKCIDFCVASPFRVFSAIAFLRLNSVKSTDFNESSFSELQADSTAPTSQTQATSSSSSSLIHQTSWRSQETSESGGEEEQGAGQGAPEGAEI